MNQTRRNDIAYIILYVMIMVCLFAYQKSSFAQKLVTYDKLFYFNNLTRENGLPADAIYAVVQDKQGYIWIGTDNGLARYDGQNFKIFHYNPADKQTIADNTIIALSLSTDSLSLWLGTFNGLSVINLYSGEIHSYYHEGKGASYFPSQVVKCFLPDKNNGMWIGTDNGIVHCKSLNIPFTLFKTGTSENPNDYGFHLGKINKMLFHPEENSMLVAASNGGVILFDTKTGKTINTFTRNVLESYNISDIYFDENKTLWTCGWVTGFNTLNVNSGKWTNFFNSIGKYHSFTSIVRYSDNVFWLGSPGDGIVTYNIKNNTFNYITHLSDNSHSLVSGSINHFDKINNKEFWVLTDAGISVEDKQFNSFKSENPPFEYLWISEFNKNEKTNKLYVAAYFCKGLFEQNQTTNQWKLIPYEQNLKQNFIDINTLYRDSKDVLWIGTRTNLMYYDEKDNMIRLFRNIKGELLNLKTPVIYGISEDKAGNLWIGTSREGVVKIDKQRKHECYYIHSDKEKNTIADGMQNRAIATDNSGRTWIGNQAGLSIYIPETNSFYVVPVDTFRKYGINKNNIYAIAKDNKGNMWLTFDRFGLVKMSADANFCFTVKIFQTANGLDDLIIKYLTLDPRGDLWICNNSLVYFNTMNEATKAFDTRSGMHNKLTGDSKIYIDNDFNLYIGNDKGYETKNISELKLTSGIENLLIDELDVNGKVFTTAFKIFPSTNYELEAGMNNITFHFTAICFHSYEKVKFSYRLEGYDDEWFFSDNIREARYTNLPAGTFTFEVKASYRGIFYPETAKVDVLIKQHFWEIWWIQVLAIMSIILLFILIYRFRMNQLLRIERIRTGIATDLHDEISSTLSGIAIIGEIMTKEISEPKLSARMKDIVAKSRSMIEKIDDIIWVVNPQNDLFENLGLRIRGFAISLFESKNIRFKIDYDEQLTKQKLSMEVRRNIYLIAKEAVNNIVKYAECNFVSISIILVSKSLELKIADNGIGFQPEIQTHRNGIKNMKYRAKQIGAKFEIISSPGNGTSIQLNLKII